jgi:protein-S-isoprenylcysteine O-methyltransferase Ste14
MAVSRTRRSLSRSAAPAAAASGAIAVIAGLIASFFLPASTGDAQAGSSSVAWHPPGWFYIVAIIVFALAMGGLVFIVFWRARLFREDARFRQEALKRERMALDSAIERLREKMALPSLIELNRLMLDQYHEIATDQAEKSFWSSQRAMWTGFGLLLASVGSALLIGPNETKFAVTSLGLASAALAGFLGRTYLRVYDSSLEQLNRYFNQPLLNSYYLTAERLVADYSNDNRDQMINEIVRHLLHTTDLIGQSSDSSRPARRDGLIRPERIGSRRDPVETASDEPSPRSG